LTAGVYFVLMTIGLPVLMLLIAAVGGYAYREGHQHLLDWIPARAGREATLHADETEQLLAAVNRQRRRRGELDRRIEDIDLNG
jgi:hypothetical protein